MKLNAKEVFRAIAVGSVVLLASGSVLAEREMAAPDADAIERSARTALGEKKYAFCTHPKQPLFHRQRDLCLLALEVEGCDGFRKACEAPVDEDKPNWGERLAKALGPVAKVLLYVLVGAIILAIAIPLIRAILKARRNRKLRTEIKKEANVASLLAQPSPSDVAGITDAEDALRLADEHRARGELDRALGLYLAASLSALDRRGAIRVAKHQTNGEYVRGCADPNAKPALREIVQAVDRVEFGGVDPTRDGVDRVASRATAIVRAAAMTALVALVALVLGCGGDARHGDDPAGDELPSEILARNGFKVAKLPTSLATMPIPEVGTTPPIVIVDTDRVRLEPDAQAHMMRFAEAGGILVLFGHPTSWPTELHAQARTASTRDLVLRAKVDLARNEDEDDETSRWWAQPKTVIRGARVAHARGVEWANAEGIAFLGEQKYAVRRLVGKGLILGVATDDLFTNVGVLPKNNATVLVTLLRIASVNVTKEIRIARPEDGIPPPTSPCAVLQAVGLGKGSWHALAAALVLFLAYGIRHARARPAAAPLRRAYAEHVEATGALYGRARKAPLALAAYGRFVEMRLRERVPRGADPIAFLAARAGVAPERAAKVYERATKAKADDAVRGDELSTIAELRELLVKALAS